MCFLMSALTLLNIKFSFMCVSDKAKRTNLLWRHKLMLTLIDLNIDKQFADNITLQYGWSLPASTQVVDQ